MDTTLAAKVGGGVVILTGTGVGGTYIATKTTVEHELEGKILEANKEKKTEWTLLVKRLERQTDEKFTKVKNSITTTNSQTEKWSLLLTWCSNKYSSTTSSAFQTKDQETLDLVKAVCSNPLIEDKVKDDVLPQTDAFNNQWKEKSKVASSKEDSKIKDVFTNKTTDDGKRDALKSWCSDKYNKPYSEKWTDNQTQLIALVEKWCIYTIKEKLDENTSNKALTTETTAGAEWAKNSKALNEHTDTNLTLAFGLEIIKDTADTNGEKKKAEVKKWCEDNWTKPFLGEDKHLYKLADKFCRKKS